MKNWRESFKPITKRRNRNHEITFDSHLKTALTVTRPRRGKNHGFGFASHWLKNWRESFKPITKRSKRNHVITFDSHLKTVLSFNIIYYKVYNEILIFFLNILAAVGDSEIRGKVKFMNF